MRVLAPHVASTGTSLTEKARSASLLLPIYSPLTIQVERVAIILLDCSINHDFQTFYDSTQWNDGGMSCYCQVKDYDHMNTPHLLSTDTGRQEELS